ncbi:MAG: hypothetical protein FRX49_04607 [Trebouxia sp. A1-2]|nr:MAG: hypothetical protein FRX49_04607 [Trebouxia sp. A1-2]
MDTDMSTDAINDLVEQYEYECLLSSRNGGTDVWGDHERPYNGSERARVQRLGRPPSSKGAILQASTWFDDVAAPRMQQMHKVQKDVVRGHDQELEGKVQQLTESLCQDMQSLKSIGTDIPVRLAVDRISLYVAEIMPMINECRAEVLDVQTQYTDGVEDFVKAVFVRGIEDAIAARDAWHLDKMKAMQVQHDQVMRNLRSSQMVEMRRTLRNQAADISRQHHTEAEWLARGDLIIARDRALLELQDLQQAHSDLQAKAAAQAESIEAMLPELEALRKAVQRLRELEISYNACQQELDHTKVSLAESSEALVLFQAAEQQHKALFGPLANLDHAAMASKLDDTLAELKLIRLRQDEVVEQQERIRANAEKAQLQREAQEQKAKARQKALAEKAMQKYSARSAFQPQAAADADGQPQRAEPIGRAPTSLQPVSSAAENLTGIEYANMTMTHSSNDQNMPLEQIMPAEPFFTNTQQQVAVQRVAQRRVGIRGATPSPILAAHRTDSLSHTQSTALGQTVTRGAAAGSPSPVFTASKLQAALQKTLGQLPKG